MSSACRRLTGKPLQNKYTCNIGATFELGLGSTKTKARSTPSGCARPGSGAMLSNIWLVAARFSVISAKFGVISTKVEQGSTKFGRPDQFWPGSTNWPPPQERTCRESSTPWALYPSKMAFRTATWSFLAAIHASSRPSYFGRSPCLPIFRWDELWSRSVFDDVAKLVDGLAMCVVT